MGLRTSRIENYKDGWLIGNFTPAFVRTEDFEVAVKTLAAGATEPAHYQRVATEITVLVSGSCELAGVRMVPGDLVELAPGEVADFVALEDTVLICIKFPSVPNDKTLIGQS
jgi:quercetin dioxygenase-like cupin family protein